MKNNSIISKAAILIFLFSFLLASFILSAQTSSYLIKGRVIDKLTNAPLQGASVFAQNTSLGSATDQDGNFSIRLPEGGYSLIVTYTGYETESIRINRAASLDSNLVFELNPKEKTLEEVSIAISSEVKDGWQKYGEFFTDNFIGQTKFAKLCIIKNPEVLHFYFSKRRNRLKVLAKDPLIVENFSLGYTLKFAIDSFTNDYNTKTILFVGYPLFAEMHGTSDQEKTWAQNRAAAYRGSILNFMRSLYSQTLQEDGFEVQFIVKSNDEEYPIKLLNLYGALNYVKDDSTNTVEFHPNQPEVAVIYNKEKPEKMYLDMDSTAKKNFQLSTFTFAKGETIVIEKNGYYYDQEDIITNGYLGFKKIGDMLPYDYNPD
ncbi:MAG: carboxypeptidase-like regulatory domain-containing protein [Bacteroidota bacterium]|nr:carboxypeptidase-like regulatory domain-containing protein [Bacteroidota bacterium]